MIEVSRLDGSVFYLNAIHVETVEATPDTLITLYSGKKLMVREKPEQVMAHIKQYQKDISANGPVFLPDPEREDELDAR
jgi:flagellar protein FlbD